MDQDSSHDDRTGATERVARVPQRKPWLSYFRVRFLVLWLAVTAIGVVLAAIPVSFPLRDLLSGAIAGAGIAGVFSEFSFCSERRDDDVDRQMLESQIESLDRQLRQIESITTDSVIVANLKTFKLGSSLALVQYKSDDTDIAPTRQQAVELAEILGVARPVADFLDQPNLLDTAVLTQFTAVRNAIQLRYSLAAQEAFNAGYTMTLSACRPVNLTDAQSVATLAFILRRALPMMYLDPNLVDYFDRGLQQFERGEVTPQLFVGFITAFNLYIDSRVMRNQGNIIRFFEVEQPDLTADGVFDTIGRLLQEIAGAPPPAATSAPAPAR